MKLADITIGEDYLVKQGSFPSAGTMQWSTFYRFHVTAFEVRTTHRGAKVWRVVGYKCKNDGTPWLIADDTGRPVEDDFTPAMVIRPYVEESCARADV